MVEQGPIWERLRAPAVGVMFVSGLYKFIKENIYVLAGAGFGVAFLDRFGLTEAVGIFVLGVLVYAIVSLVGYWRFRFTYTSEDIRLRQGLFNQIETRVAFDRVQSIEVLRPFYFRPFDLVVLSLQTPGQAKPEIVLAGITQSLANHLRGLMGQTAAVDDHQPPMITVPPGRLFKAGLSSELVWVVAGGLAYVGTQVIEWMTDRMEQANWLDGLADSVWASPATVLGLAVSFVLLVFIATGFYTMLVHLGSSLWVHSDKLINQRGALSTRLSELQRDRVTGLLATQSPLGRLFGIWTTTVHQTSSEDVLTQGRGERAFRLLGLVPIEVASLAPPVLGATWPGAFNAISVKYQRLWRGRWLALLFVAGLIGAGILAGSEASVNAQWLTRGAGVFFVALVMMWVLVASRYRRWGWCLDEGYLWVRSGLVGTRIQGVALERIQQIRVVQSPYQVRHGLASLVLVLPQGEITVPFVGLRQAQQLANTVAWVIER